MKKLLSLLLAVVVLLAGLGALAEAGETGAGQFYQALGLTMDVQSVLDSCVNYASVEMEEVLSHDPYVAEAQLRYFAIPTAEVDALFKSAASGEEEDALMQYLYSISAPISCIFVTDAPDANAMFEAIDEKMEPNMKIEEIAVKGSWRYIYVQESPNELLAIYDDHETAGMELTDAQAMAAKKQAAAEIERVHAEVADKVRTGAFVTPEDPDGALIGKTLRFETTDLDGNAVSSEELFRDNRITLVNLWGSWCPSCVAELPDLVALYGRLREKGCGVVGVEFEYEQPEVYRPRAERIIAEAGITYPNVLRPEGNPVFSEVYGYPTSYFVDSEGKILTYPIGIWIDRNERIVDKLLAGETVDLVPDSDATPGNGDRYCIYVFDTDGKPVQGVIIQLCDDSSCTLQPTDANGVAAFEGMAQKVYEIHVLKVPEGFRQDEKSYQTLESYSDVSIFLDRAE